MSLREIVPLAAVISGLLPVGAALIRGHSRLMLVAAALTGITTLAFFLFLFRLAELGNPEAARPWAYLLLASMAPLLVSGYLYSVILGRDHPHRAFRSSLRTFVLLGLGGITFVALTRHSLMMTEFEAIPERARIHLGPLGKAYLSYLLVGIVLAGYNLESTYRTASAHSRQHLRLSFFGLFAILAFLTYVLTMGLLYSVLTTDRLLALSGPVIFGNCIVAYGFLRGSLVDTAAPVSRNIVYSSFTALAAGLYVVAVGVMAQVSSFTKWSPDELVSISLGFLAVLLAAFFLISNRFQRRVRRFIDRNFYVNRYDYRARWSRVTRAMEGPRDPRSILREATSLLEDILSPDATTISLKDQVSGIIRPAIGKGVENQDAVLRSEDPLYQALLSGRSALLLDQRPDDFEYIAIYAENQDWLRATAGQIVAPLMVGDDLVGLVGLERHEGNEPYSFEDAAMLESVTTHVSAALHSARLSEELAESREMELLSNWSSMLLHDLKNYLSPLRMIGENLIAHSERPGIHEIVARDINRIADTMEARVRTLSDIREKPLSRHDSVNMNELAEDTLQEMKLDHYGAIRVRKHLRSTRGTQGDAKLLRRLLENLVMNAVQAMDGKGTLEIGTEDQGSPEEVSGILVTIADDGPGMSEEFIRNQLFRPFVSTKSKGLGLGMYQCRSIVRAHGGSIRVSSNVGKGTTFQIFLRAAPLAESAREGLPVSVAQGASTS